MSGHESCLGLGNTVGDTSTLYSQRFLGHVDLLALGPAPLDLRGAEESRPRVGEAVLKDDLSVQPNLYLLDDSFGD